jgi:hypothetical protein
MEPFLETIDLDIEEANELLFKVKVEGVDQAPAKVRLVCETGDVDYMFHGEPTPDEGVVQFVLPSLKGKLKEGQYLSRVEVLIENRYFAPVSFNINFKQAVKVVAEAIRIPAKKTVPTVSVTASAPVVVRKPLPPPVPVVTEARPAVIQARPAKKKSFAPKIPTPQPVSRPQTLRERYARKQDETTPEATGEELIKELARSFVNHGEQ